MKRFDAHNHLQLQNGLAENLLTEDFASAICSTVESDWSSVLALAASHPSHIVAGLGLHPWWANQAQEGWAERLEQLLIQHPLAFIGEAGFDGYRASRARGVVLEDQRKVLLPQLHLAAKLSRPIVLHCVKAWEHLHAYLLEINPPHFAIHRFKGDALMAKEIFGLGGYISVHQDSLFHAPTMEALASAPLQRLLLETDFDGPRVGSLSIPVELEQVADGLAKLVNKSPEWISKQCYENAQLFYGITMK